MKYKVSEIFNSIQGEGLFSGLVTTFIRLSGCSLKCKFCDSKKTWRNGKELSIKQIVRKVTSYGCGDICITGGEPFEQDITSLAKELLNNGYKIQIETNGTQPIPKEISDKCFISCSPKGDILWDYSPIWNQVKYIVANKNDIKQVREISGMICGDIYLCVQPIWGSKEALKLCVDEVIKNDKIKLSLQMHKYMGIK